MAGNRKGATAASPEAALAASDGDFDCAVRLETVSKDFGSVRAVRDLSLEVGQGEVFGLLGPNGAGKTTTISMLLGLTAPSSGSATVLGFDPIREPLRVRANIGLVLQQPAHDPYLTGWENVQLHAELYPMTRSARHERIAHVLDWAGLLGAHQRLVRTYSGGMKRRLELAISLLNRPRLLLLDEPTLGLDIHTRHQVWQLVEDMRAQGITVLLTTHYLEEANQLCDRIAIINHGKLVALDTPEALRREVVGDIHRLKVSLLRAPEELDLPLEGTAQGGWIVFSGQPKQLWRTLAVLQEECGDDILEVNYQQPSLDDVFLRLTGSREVPGA